MKPNAAGIPDVSSPQNGLAYVNRTDRYQLIEETIVDALIRLRRDAANQPAVMWATGHGAEQISWSELGDRAQRGAAIQGDERTSCPGSPRLRLAMTAHPEEKTG